MPIKTYQSIIIVILIVLSVFSASAFSYTEKTDYKTPVRERSIIISKEGYYPKVISLHRGEKLKIYLTSTTSDPSCLMMRGKKIFLSATKGKISEGEIDFNEVGKFEYYCPTGKIKGTVVVIEPPKEKERRIRSLASKRRVKVWRPREE